MMEKSMSVTVVGQLLDDATGIFTAHRVFSAEPSYNFAYHRLERSGNGDIVAMTYDQEALGGADEANFEVR